METLLPGSVVFWKKKRFIVEDLIGFDEVIVRRDTGTKQFVAPVSEVTQQSDVRSGRFIHAEKSEQWRDAVDVFKLLRPLLEKESHCKTIQDVTAVAKQLGVSRSTVYDYIKRWKSTQKLSTFMRKQRTDKGSSRLMPAVAALVEEVIQNFYATAERPSPTDTFEEIKYRCQKANLPIPAKTTVVRYIDKQSKRKMMKARYGSREARHKYEPIHGHFPGADFPLAVVQIDHTPMDMIVLDENREPWMRPTLTIAIDVCTRMLLGFCITMEKAGHLNTALALVHGMLPKDEFLKKHNLTQPWPMHGKPRKVFVDNAREFRGTALKRGCEQHDIILENRPKGMPQYAGHVERAFRSFMQALHRIPGTTFSNTIQKAKYDSKKRAIMTLEECEEWFTIFITYRYHHKLHSETGYPPIKLYQRYILGDDEVPGIGLPAPMPNADILLWDFLQPFERVISPMGVEIDCIHYFDNVLRPWVNAVDPDDRKKNRKFIFTRDPRDISRIRFYDPDLREHFFIPYRDRTRPPMSIWELEAVKRELKLDPNRQVDEAVLFEGYERMRNREDASAKATTKERQNRSRRKTAQRLASQRPAHDDPHSLSEQPSNPSLQGNDWADKADDVPDFDIETI